MISGATEEELELATARMDIMLATNYTPDNPGPLAIIDKCHDKEIERLNNIINELVLSCYGSDMSLAEFENIWEIAFNKKYNPKEIDKLKELKEGR